MAGEGAEAVDSKERPRVCGKRPRRLRAEDCAAAGDAMEEGGAGEGGQWEGSRPVRDGPTSDCLLPKGFRIRPVGVSAADIRRAGLADEASDESRLVAVERTPADWSGCAEVEDVASRDLCRCGGPPCLIRCGCTEGESRPSE